MAPSWVPQARRCASRLCLWVSSFSKPWCSWVRLVSYFVVSTTLRLQEWRRAVCSTFWCSRLGACFSRVVLLGGLVSCVFVFWASVVSCFVPVPFERPDTCVIQLTQLHLRVLGGVCSLASCMGWQAHQISFRCVVLSGSAAHNSGACFMMDGHTHMLLINHTSEPPPPFPPPTHTTHTDTTHHTPRRVQTGFVNPAIVVHKSLFVAIHFLWSPSWHHNPRKARARARAGLRFSVSEEFCPQQSTLDLREVVRLRHHHGSAPSMTCPTWRQYPRKWCQWNNLQQQKSSRGGQSYHSLQAQVNELKTLVEELKQGLVQESSRSSSSWPSPAAVQSSLPSGQQ